MRHHLRLCHSLPRLRPLAWLAFVSIVVQGLSIPCALAADYAVTKIADTNDGACSADCSLREAVAAANANAGSDRIILGSALTYALTLGPFDGAGVVTPGSGDLDITGALTIDGNYSTVDGGGIDRVFDIQGGFAVTINTLTIRRGIARGFLSLGGGLNIRGAAVVLNNSVVTANNTAIETSERDPGGGIAVIGMFNAATGVATVASLTLNNTTVSANTGSNGGGIICVLCTLTTSSATITGNTANGSDGGGIVLAGNSSAAQLTSSALTLNTVSGGAARGGALSVPVGLSSAILTRTRIVANTGAGGSGVFNQASSVQAANDWWGCNYGPGVGGSGCAGTPNGVAGTVVTIPFLVMKGSASPASVAPGGTSVLTADLTLNSLGGDTLSGGRIPNDTIVAFSATLGTFAAPSSPTANGKATGLFTAGASAGPASLSAILDGQTVITTVPVVACAFSLAPPSASVPATTTTGSSVLTANGASCAWSASSNNGFIAVTSPASATGSGSVAWSVVRNPITSARSGTITVAGLTFTITQAASVTGRRVPSDFNHDGVIDLGVFRPAPGRFLIAGQPNTDWGAAGDLPVTGDFNGDGNPDVAVFRPANGTWYINGGSTIVWGAAGDIPVPGDYDGNGTTDIAVFRPSAGLFYIRNGATVAWGLAGDLPVVGDYDGNGSDDIAVYRPATGTWYVRNVTTAVFGFAADLPVPADYDGDGDIDIAVFRPATGTWIVKDQYTQVWGAAGDVPVPLDRNGDGVAELGVFRRATGTCTSWIMRRPSPRRCRSVPLATSPSTGPRRRCRRGPVTTMAIARRTSRCSVPPAASGSRCEPSAA